MVQVDIPMAFATGSFLADAARIQIKLGNSEYTWRAIFKNNLFQIFFFSWIPVYFILNYFGWETTYLWWHADSVTAYPYFVPVFLIIFFLASNGGFFLGKTLIARNHLLANRLVILALTLYSLIWVFGQTARTFQVGTFSEWSAHQSLMFYQNHTFLYMFIFVMALWLVAAVVFYLNVWREGVSLAKKISPPSDGELRTQINEGL